MKPYLIPKDFDLAQLCDSSGTPLFTSDNLSIYVLKNNPSIPTNNGIGILNDAKSCLATYELNGIDDLQMTYPITGQFYDQIELRSVIVANVGRTRGNQPYRVYRISKPLKGVVTIYAHHLAYDLQGIPIEPFEASNISTALQGMKSHAMIYNPFTFTSTRSTTAQFRVSVPTSAWALMGGQQGSILDVYGGEYTFDGYNITLENRVGADNNVSVRYGVNMTDLKQDENIASCYTGVVAFWKSEDEEVHSPVMAAGGKYGYVRILTVDMSDKWETKPSVEQLKSAASAYITKNEIGIPKVSLTVNWVPLDITEEYKHLAILERVGLGDTVSVAFERLGVDAKARVIKIVWDVLKDRYESVSLGNYKPNIADTIAGQAREMAQKPTKAETRFIAESIGRTLSVLAMGLNGGTVRFIDTNGDDEPDTLYVADNPDPALAVNVWRWDYRGWAGSKNGYNGPFVMGATLDGGILADFITAGVLNAGLVKILSEGDIGSGFGNALATFNGQFLEGTQKDTTAPLWRLGTGVVDTGSGYVASGNLELYAVGSGIDNSKPVISIGALDGESWGIVIRDPYSGYTGHISLFFNPDTGLYMAFNDGSENTVRIQGDGGVVSCKRLIVNGHEIT